MKHGLIAACALVLLIFSCKNKDEIIPNTFVDITIHVSDPAYSNLNAIGGWVYIPGGVKGIIVYKRSPEDFMAYDRNCTYLPSNACSIVSVTKDNITLSDSPCCPSRFQIIDGGVTKGPATRGLKTYLTSFDGSVLRIYSY